MADKEIMVNKTDKEIMVDKMVDKVEIMNKTAL